MARSSRRNFWDNVRRKRNSEKPEYWENWAKENTPQVGINRRDQSDAFKFTFSTGKLTASEARFRLKSLGLTGNKLSSTVRSVMKGDVVMAWVEYDLYLEKLKRDGFFPIVPFEECADGRTMARFERVSASGEIDDVVTIWFSRNSG